MDKTPRILTIIGLIFEGVGVVGSFFGGWLMVNFDSLPGVSPSSMDMSQADFNELIEFMAWLGDIIYGIAIVLGVIFILNLYIFTKLIGSKYEEASAKKVYLYQAIWGGINILFNQITGILYLISGVSGYSGHIEETNIREGI
jgi:hypothetical protein